MNLKVVDTLQIDARRHRKLFWVPIRKPRNVPHKTGVWFVTPIPGTKKPSND